jgi:hypothetical protein
MREKNSARGLNSQEDFGSSYLQPALKKIAMRFCSSAENHTTSQAHRFKGAEDKTVIRAFLQDSPLIKIRD